MTITQQTSSRPDFRERAKANDVPVARLIGFETERIGEGRAAMVLAAGPQHANPMGMLHGGILCDIADAAMGGGLCKHFGARRIVHHNRIEDKFLPTSLAGSAQG
jgi:acyl-coenzyme A thioesterase PaaI-like protein